jgi:hypothetical protein
LYILIKCIFKSVDIIFKLFVKYLNYFEVSKKIKVFLDLFFSPFIFLPTGKSPLLWRYVTHLSIVVFNFAMFAESKQKARYWPMQCHVTYKCVVSTNKIWLLWSENGLLGFKESSQLSVQRPFFSQFKRCFAIIWGKKRAGAQSKSSLRSFWNGAFVLIAATVA